MNGEKPYQVTVTEFADAKAALENSVNMTAAINEILAGAFPNEAESLSLSVEKLEGAIDACVRTPVPADPERFAAVIGALGETPAGAVRVRTTSPVDPARAGEFVRIDPPVPVTFAPDWRGLKIPGAFEPEKRYRVTLEAGLPAAAAGSPGETVPRTVWFDHLPPKLEFASGDGYLRPGGLLRIPVRSRNVGRFTARLRRLYPENLVETAMRDYGLASCGSTARETRRRCCAIRQSRRPAPFSCACGLKRRSRAAARTAKRGRAKILKSLS